MLGDHLGADRDRRAGHRGRTPATPRCPAVRRYPASTQGRPFPAGLGSRRGGARKHPAATVADLSTAASAAVSDVESAGRSSTTGRAARRRRRTPPRGAALESAPGRAAAAPTIPAPRGARRGRRWIAWSQGLTEPAYPTHRPHRPARTVIVGPGPAHNRVPPAPRDPRIDRPARIGLTAEHTCGFRAPDVGKGAIACESARVAAAKSAQAAKRVLPMCGRATWARSSTSSRRGRAGTPSWRARRTRSATGKNARADRGGHGHGSRSRAGGRRCRASRRNRKAEVFDEV